MKKKVLAMVIASMMSATLFAGCGSSSSNDTGNDTKSDDTNEDIASEDETTKDDNSSEGSTPRNETLYFNGQQWGVSGMAAEVQRLFEEDRIYLNPKLKLSDVASPKRTKEQDEAFVATLTDILASI